MARVLRVMSILAQVKIKPSLLVEPSGGPFGSGRMERDQMLSPIAAPQPARHGANNLFLDLAIHTTVAAQDPNNGFILVALAQPRPICFRIGRRKNGFPTLDLIVPERSPSGQKTEG